MYKVVVVEDVKVVLEDLVYRITKQSPDYRICGTAMDGDSAAALIEDFVPDLLVTDIRIPRRTGIQLVDWAKKVNPDMKFMIISGYADFDYAQELMAYGVTEYLLKPVKEKQFTTSLSKLAEQIDEIRKTRADRLQNKSLELSAIEIAQRAALEEVIVPQCDRDSVTRFYKVIGRIPSAAYFSGMFQHVHNFRLSGTPFREGDRALIGRMVLNILHEACRENDTIVLPLANGNNETILVLHGESREQVSRKSAQLAEQLVSAVRWCLRLDSTIGIGETVLGAEGLRMTLQAAKQAADNRFSRGCGIYHATSWEQTDLPSYDNNNIKLELLKDLLNVPIPMIRWKNVHDEIRNLFSPVLLTNCPASAPRTIFMEIIVVLSRFKRDGQFGSKFVSEALSGELLSQFDAYLDMIDYLLDVVGQLQKKVDKLQDGSFRIEVVKAYLDEHYSEKITLTETAALFNISYAYLSDTFKRKYRINFIDYLNQLRINKARLLLTETDLSSECIADMLSYSNSSYFFRLFKRYEGMTPLEYRNAKR